MMELTKIHIYLPVTVEPEVLHYNNQTAILHPANLESFIISKLQRNSNSQARKPRFLEYSQGIETTTLESGKL
jgi:hypothetical protein